MPNDQPAQSPTDAGAPDRLVVEHYRHTIPAFVAEELARVYENPYSCLHKLIFCAEPDFSKKISTYVVRQDGIIITLWLYREIGTVAHVLNELIEVSQADVVRFSESLFARESGIAVVAFHAIRTTVMALPFISQRYNHSEDIVVQLPDNADAYLAQLKKSFRKTITGYRKKLVQSFPDFQYQVLDSGAVSEAQVRAVIELNRSRMSKKNKQSDFDEAAIRQLLCMCRYCGLVGLATVDGKICGGTIAYCIGGQYYLQVIAHDAAFNRYRLGHLVAYLSLVDCIRRGGSQVHLLWGRYDFKYALLGETHDLDNLVVYRSQIQFLLHLRLVCSTMMQGWRRRYCLWLHQRLHEKRALPQTLLQISHWLRLHI